MTKILLLITSFFILSCNNSKTQESKHFTRCNVNVSFEIEKQNSIEFFNSEGKHKWNWKNDSLDIIFSYFSVNEYKNGMIRIDSIIILYGYDSIKEGWELPNAKPNKIIESLEGSWLKLSKCSTELSEWMLYGNYSEHRTPYIYEYPNNDSIKHRFDPRKTWLENQVRILEIQGTWFNVEFKIGNKILKGWMPSYNLCAHPYTTCN